MFCPVGFISNNPGFSIPSSSITHPPSSPPLAVINPSSSKKNFDADMTPLELINTDGTSCVPPTDSLF